VLFILVMIWLLPKLWRGIRKVFSLFTRGNNAQPASTTDTDEKP